MDCSGYYSWCKRGSLKQEIERLQRSIVSSLCDNIFINKYPDFQSYSHHSEFPVTDEFGRLFRCTVKFNYELDPAKATSPEVTCKGPFIDADLCISSSSSSRLVENLLVHPHKVFPTISNHLQFSSVQAAVVARPLAAAVVGMHLYINI